MNVAAVATPALVGLMLAGIVIALFYGAFLLAEVIRTLRLSPLVDPAEQGAFEQAPRFPTRRFKRQSFEASWQGAQGYDRPPSAVADNNWVDRLIIPTISVLRPSRFKESSYWTRYLPSAGLLWAALFIGVPSTTFLITQPSLGPIATFVPTQMQRSVSVPGAASHVRQGLVVNVPSDCHDVSANRASSPLTVSDEDDGTVFGVRPGTRVDVSPDYGHALFSNGVPLCTDGHRNEYVAARTGAGFIFFPEPTETMVAGIEVATSRPDTVGLFIIIGSGVMVIDILLVIFLRRISRTRWTPS